MRKFGLYSSLALINLTPIIYIICLKFNIKIWEYCVLGSAYQLNFAIGYFAENAVDIVIAFVGVILINIIMSVTILVSHFKMLRVSNIAIIICLLDIIMNVLLVHFIVIVLDILLIALIILSDRKEY